ncbi:MAG: MATE family efflux transporter [Myxococcales bacterium]|jgi:putative MATE family efflux protein
MTPAERATLSAPRDLGERVRQILALGLPIMGGMVSQNALNLIDTAMVGRLGDSALAAVGTASFLNMTAVALFMGASAGVQAVASRRMGEGRSDEAAAPLNGAIAMIAATAIPLSALLFVLAPLGFPFVNDDPAVIAQGVPYLQARLVAVFAAGINAAFRGYWNGVHRSGLYMRTLLFMHALNVLLNWVLIFGHLGMPALGTLGAGIGTAIATYAGTVFYVVLGFRHARHAGFARARPERATLASVFKVGLPAGVQVSAFIAGQAVLFWIVGMVGTAHTAASNVLINLMLLAILPAHGLGMAGATLVGQALGREQPDDARRWGLQVGAVAMAVVTVVSAVLGLFPGPLLSVFMDNPESRALAVVPLQLIALSLPIDAAGMVLMSCLGGAGASRLSMWVSVVMQWALFLPLAALVGPVLGYGLLGIWLVYAVYRLLQTAVYSGLWMRGSWATIRL